MRRLLATVMARRAGWLRRQYPGGRGSALAKRLSRLWAGVFALGVLPRRWVTLEVRGRRTGVLRRFPIGLADLNGHWYAVSMLGECAWTRNVRACGGQAVLRRRGGWPVTLVELAEPDRPLVIKQYLTTVPGGRPHIAVDYRRPVEDFASVAGGIPVFAVHGDLPPPRTSRPSR